MKIQFLNGGLANQTFQYIFTRYYELSHPGQQMFLDDSYFAMNTVHNGYELEKVFPNTRPHLLSKYVGVETWDYILDEKRKGKSVPQILKDIDIPITMLSEVADSYKTFNPFDGDIKYVEANAFQPQVCDLPYENIYYHGYWIHRDWLYTYKDTLLLELAFPEVTEPHNIAYMNAIHNSNSVSIHIRRGDFVKIGWSLPTEQIREIILHFLDNTPKELNFHAFVFSDDIPWCQENFTNLGLNKFVNCTFVEGNTNGLNYRDIQLMSNCKAMIQSNSSFGYLAALLNQTKQYILNPFSQRPI